MQQFERVSGTALILAGCLLLGGLAYDASAIVGQLSLSGLVDEATVALTGLCLTMLSVGTGIALLRGAKGAEVRALSSVTRR